MNTGQDKIRQRIPLFVFFIGYLLFSLGTYRDYGCTWDEQDVYQGGAELFQYVVRGVQPAYLDPEHSYPYAGFLALITSPANYEFLHLLNLLFAVSLFWVLFEVLLAQDGKPWLALVGPVFLFLTPSFSGSIPANPKDIPFAIFYFLSLAAIYWFEQKLPDFKVRWAILGILFAFAISSRIVGFTLFPVLILFDAYLFWWKGGKKKRYETKDWLWKKSKEWLGVGVTSQILCMVLWPYLGERYFQHLMNVFWLSAHFPPKFAFLFMGGLSDSLSYSWIYLPVWILVSTPFFVLAFFLISLWRAPSFLANQLYVLLGIALGLNLVIYFGLHPAIYDGLRHYLFLMPILSALSALAFIDFFGKGLKSITRKAAGALVLLGAGLTASQMIQLHPYEYVYFNEAVGGFRGAYGRYETDYWVASMKEAVLWLKANEIKDPNKRYKIFADGKPFQSQAYFAPNMEAVSSPKDADYSIVMTRAGIKPSPEDQPKIIHRVEREGAPLSFVLRLR